MESTNWKGKACECAGDVGKGKRERESRRMKAHDLSTYVYGGPH